MYIHVGLVVVATLCLGATRAEYEGLNAEGGQFYLRDARDTSGPVDRNVQHRPIALPAHGPQPHVHTLEYYPNGKQHVRHAVTEEVPDEIFGARLPRSINRPSFPRPGPRPQPSPTFPRPPRPSRFRREAEVDDELVSRYVRSLRHYERRYPNPVPSPSPTFPRPDDNNGPVLARFRRGGGRVSVDVEKSRGSKSTTRVTAEQNIYKSGNGRTRVDASGYATNRGDRGGMINLSHDF